MSQVPSRFQFLFPSDVVSELKIQQNKPYIIATLLKNANLSAWKWLLANYSRQDIIQTIKTATDLKKKDVMIWSNYLNIPTQDIICLQTKSQAGLKSSWAY